jgi:hypothetical protein
MKLSILTAGTQNPKTAKPPEGYDVPVVNDLLHLAPADLAATWARLKWDVVVARADEQGWGDKLRAYGQERAQGINVCTSASEGCKGACLNVSGHAELDGAWGVIQRCRVMKTLRYFADREGFMSALRSDISRRLKACKENGVRYVCRVNGTSDLPALAMQLASEFPEVMFYDYTAHPKPWTRERENYRLTFSRKENNDRDCLLALSKGVNVAVAFQLKRGAPLPERYMGRKVIDGDLHDHRWLDPRGVIVGLRVKGRANAKDTSGFIVECPA